MKTEIQEKLEQLAFDRTTPFCLGCQCEAKNGKCPSCHSDDLGRLHKESGNADWFITSEVIRYILEEELALTPVDADEVFEDSIHGCYPEETIVGWMKFDTVTLMKDNDPISWRIAKDEYMDSLEQDEEIISFDGGSNYYWKHDLESLLE